MKDLILPGSVEYEVALGTLPFGWRHDAHRLSGECAFVADGETGLLRTVSTREMWDYVFSGEYDERLAKTDSCEIWEDLLPEEWGDLSDSELSELEFCWIDF